MCIKQAVTNHQRTHICLTKTGRLRCLLCILPIYSQQGPEKLVRPTGRKTNQDHTRTHPGSYKGPPPKMVNIKKQVLGPETKVLSFWGEIKGRTEGNVIPPITKTFAVGNPFHLLGILLGELSPNFKAEDMEYLWRLPFFQVAFVL